MRYERRAAHLAREKGGVVEKGASWALERGVGVGGLRRGSSGCCCGRAAGDLG